LTFWDDTKRINFVHIVIRYWRPNCITYFWRVITRLYMYTSLTLLSWHYAIKVTIVTACPLLCIYSVVVFSGGLLEWHLSNIVSLATHLSYHSNWWPYVVAGNNIAQRGDHFHDIEDKSNQWFGASLYSSSNGIVVVSS